MESEKFEELKVQDKSGNWIDFKDVLAGERSFVVFIRNFN